MSEDPLEAIILQTINGAIATIQATWRKLNKIKRP